MTRPPAHTQTDSIPNTNGGLDAIAFEDDDEKVTILEELPPEPGQLTMASIRPECLRPADDGWEPPTAAEVRAVISETGMSGSEVGRFLGISSKGSRVIRRWAGGEDQIPYSAWALLCDRAGYRRIWERQKEEDFSG